MNKHCYRLIFSRTHGELRVVSELARSCSSEPGQRIGSGITGGSRLWVTVRRSVWLLGLLMFAGPVMADGIVADGGANPSQRPEVITTQNGLPQVNITAPNQAGVSHNQYQQFDVDAKGAILNNSAVMTATQMAGMIQGNPNLNPNSAPARVILNEVNSNNPSQLRGFMEVAGGKAQVIVANPAGIVCNGCGTINAGRMTLTTGKPQLNADGSVAGYQVERGVVRIEGGGLNGDTRHDTEYVDILARAVEVNAGVWAKEGVSVVAGRNRVSADGKTAAPLSDDGSARPELAIDMGQMGGMYSGSIRMIGTEAGVGVRNQGGQVRAGKTLTVSSEGKLSWRSDAPDAATQAGGDIQLAAKGDIETHGKVYSGGQLAIESREGMLTQSGTLAAAGNVHLNAARGIQSSGHLLAGSNVESALVHDANLQLDSQGDIRASGSLLGKKNVNASGRRVDISGAQVAAGRTALAAREGGVALRQSTVDSGELAVSTKGNVDAQQAKVKAGRWAVDADNLFNQQATWSQTGDGESRFTLAGALDNSDGTIETQSLRLSAGQLVNQRGRLVALGETAQHWRVGGLLDNGGGTMGSNGALRLDAGRLDNQRGTIKTQAGLTLHVDGAVNNAGGNLLAGNGLTLEAGSDLNNQSGTLSGDDVRLAVQRLDNAQGQVIGQGNLEMTAGRLDNQHGLIGAGKALNVHAGDWDNRGGTAQGETAVTATASNLNNDGGKLLSGHASTLQTSGNATNRGGEISATVLTVQSDRLDNTQGKVIGRQRLNLHARQGLDNTQGLLGADEMLTVSSEGELSNHHGRVQGNGQTTVSARDIHNEAGKLLGGQRLSLTASGVLGNRGGKIQGGDALTFDAQALNNAGGTIDGQQRVALRILGLLENTGGAVRSNGGQEVSAAGINNTRGVFSSRGGITVASKQLDNTGGTLISQGAGTYRLDRLNNQHGKVHSGDALTLEGAQVNNRGGQLVSTQGLALKAGTLDNSGQGTLSSQAELDVQAERLNNRDGGLILGTTRTDITSRDIDNTAGRLQSSGQMTLAGVTQLDNRQGRILANGNLNINTDRSRTDSPLALLNQGGRVESAGQLTLHGRTLDNQNGTLLGLQALTLSAQQDYTHQAGETISSNGTVTFSLSGAFTNLADWLLPGKLALHAASITNPAALVGKTLQLTTGALQNTGRLEADSMTLNVDTLDNAAALMGDDITVNGRIIDNHGAPAVMAATHSLTVQAGERLTNREGALIYSADRLHLHSDDLIENRASFIEADGDATVEARRLNNLREGLVIERNAEKSDYKWHRYNYYWRSYGSKVNPDKSTMALTTQQLTYQDDAAAQTNRYGTLLAIDAAGKRAQVRVKDNKGQLTDLWVNYLALKPNADGSYAMTFYETRGGNQLATIPTPYQNGFHWEHDWTQVMTWDPEKHVDIDSAPFITDYNNFRERTESGTVTRDKLVSEGIGARILAGGNMVLRITGTLLNDASVITANGNLTQDGGGSVDNRGYSVNERRQAAIVDHYDKDTHHWYPTFNRDETTALATVDGVITGNGTVTINGARITNTTVNQAQISQLDAALKAVDAERAELERNPLAFTVDGAARPDGDTTLAPGEQMTRPGATPSSPLGRPLLPSELALTQLQHLGNVATAIPNNGLFSQHTAIGSPFLVVTDERFTRRDNFISSDYMLERVGYDPAQAHKRLGDGFYEQRLVREQVLALTGKPSVKGWDAMEQYQQLMNNGSKVAQDFHLVPGVALTPEQIAALQQDIVWLVSETVQTEGGPQTVWVPKVYLAQTTLRLTGDGAVIGGGDLQLSANSITNAGNLFAEKALTVDAGQFLHQGGDVRAGSIDVQADSLAMSTNLQDALRQATMSAGDIRLRGTDITLTGAKLDATDTLSLSARNDLTITAAKSSHTADLEVISGSMGNRTRGGTEAAGSRMAHVSGEWQQALGSELNAGGNHTLDAGRDVTFTGSQASAAGSTRVQAGGDINIRAESTTNTTHLDANSRTSSVSNDRQEERLTVSALGGDQGVTLVAGNRLLAEGAQIDSKEGRIGVSARDVTIKDARTRTQDQDSENKREGKTKSHREEQTEREISTGSTFSGREGVTVIGREGDVTVTGSTLHSDQGAIALQAKNDVILNHTTDSEHRVSNEESRGRKTRGERAEEVLRENVVGSTLSGQGGVTVVAQDGSIIATASTLHSDQGAIALQAKQDVTLNTATERESALSEERSQKKGFLKKSSSHSVAHDATTREKGSLLSGNSVSVSAGNDLTVTGSAIAADQDVNLQAGRNVDIGAATETDTHYRLEEKKKSGLLGSGGIGFTIGKQSSKHEIDEKGRTQSQSVSTVGSSQGSVNVTAGNQLHIGGADLVAAKDLALTGDSVTIDPGVDARTRKETYEQKQSGLSVALSGTVGGALNTAVSSAQQARKEGDGRLTALQNTKAALSGVQAAQAWERDNALTASAEAKNAAAGLQPGDEGAAQGATNTVGISASYGSQSSKSETRTDSRQSQGSTLTAGQNLSITASGKNHNAQSGDIVVTGSQLKAGKDLSLDAARDITLQSAQNRESTVGKNSSKGGNVGVGIGAGSGGYGISVSAGVNAGKGHENGNGLTHAETTLDAGSNLKVTSGRDTRLTGAQASGEKVTVDVGRNLALESQQDSDRYDAKQQNASAGGSFTFGSMTGSANLSASKDKLHSNFDSVKEQTGLFAGQGGYDVKVKEHTQLDGAVIASQADKEKNRLDTGTLGWTDIHNQADYSATHSGGSFSTGGPVGKDLLTNMAGGMLSGANHSGHAEGTTKAGVSEGTLIVRDTGKQQQDVAQLNRDTEHANAGSISPIFNKEKEQNRLKQAQLIGEIGGQAMDVIRTQGDIAGLKAQKDPAALSQAREQLEKSGKPTNDAAVMQRAYDNAMRQYGTGSDLQKAAQAVTGALTALAGNNLAGALASGASPYLATEIKKLTTNPLTGEVDVAANTMAHAVLGAVTAQLNNQSAAAGGLGAGGGELAARYIAGQLFPGKTAQQLSESEKQQVSALSQLAAGLAGGLATGDTAGAVTGGQAGKNAVENNALSDLVDAVSQGKTPQQVAEERVDAENERYKQQNCAGMSAEACSVKMYTERREELKDILSTGADFVPVVGDIKSFAEAQSALDYLVAAIGIIPGAGDAAGKAIKAAETALKKGDVAEASKLINEGSQQVSAKAKEVQIWSETKKKEPVSNAYGHWDKHKKEFPEFQNSKQYVEAAHSFVNNPPPGTLVKVRPNGETVYYNPATNTFAVKRTDNVPRTMFKPNPADHGYKTNLDYFNAQ
ncbi:TPA: hemagglutinin repeat-containing protein [Serratia marcescens]|nr:hemagglutinin repeat-containing protein [Serratia marcescens]